jgi:hypothetical protein
MDAFQKWRLHFCEEWVARMPPELRDMTYDYILEPEYAVYINEDFKYEELSLEQRLPATIDTDIISLFEAQHVGRHVVDDISRSLFTRESFNVGHHTLLNCALTSAFLPRGLRVHWYVWQTSKAEVDTMSKVLLDRQVQGRTTIELVLHLQPPECGAFLRRVAPTIFKLPEKGASIIVTRAYPRNTFWLRPNHVFWSFHRLRKPVVVHDLTWLVAGDMEDFKRNMMCNGKKRTTIVSLRLYVGEFLTNCFERPSWASRTL